MRKIIIDAKSISKRFGENSALNDLSLEIYENEIFGVIGPDGSGKTTLLRILSGVLMPDKGRVEIFGCDIIKDPEVIKSKVGVVPQSFSLYGDLTVEENLDFFSKMYGVDKETYLEKRNHLLRITNLIDFINRRAEHLSGGMQKKLALITSLIHNPELLILDEPTTGIDPIARRELWDFFYRLLKTKTTIIVSTPYIDEMERCTRVGFLYRGRFLLIDESENILSKYSGKNFDDIFISLIKEYECNRGFKSD